MTQVLELVVHQNPHFDEVLAVWLLKKFGEKMFPGVSQAKLTFHNNGISLSSEEYEKKGILLVGLGGGRFDEHPANGNGRKEGECAATLVAAALGLKDDPVLQPLLRYVVNCDLKGNSHPFDLSSVLKQLLQQNPQEQQEAVDWVFTGIEAKFQQQLNFLNVCKEDLANGEIEKIPGRKGILTLVTVKSDSPEMSRFARSQFGCEADIIIQQNKLGNVQIFTNAKSCLKMYDVVQMIRLREQQIKGKISTWDWKTLSSEGKIPGAEEWFFHEEGQMLLNGSLTASNVPATKIPLEEIKALVKAGVNPQEFEPKRAHQCGQGHCTSTPNLSCNWYAFGLRRCRQVRYQQSN
jgi:hypothetical protein